MKGDVQALILEVVDEVREQQQMDRATVVGLDTKLFGEGGLFDSMGLVTLVVAVEQAIAERLGQSVQLADEKALSQRSSPYRTVGSLAAYAAGQLRG
jgi:acyl carrier protein